MPKPLTVWITNWKILKERGIPDHLTCFLRNLYADQEATVRTGCGKTDWFQIGKGVHQGCILSPCLFKLHAEFSWVRSLSHVRLCDLMDGNVPGLPVHQQLPQFTQTHVHWVSDAILPSYPLSSPFPSIFPSIRVFSHESVLHIRWPKYWSFSFSISPSNEYSGLISFRMYWYIMWNTRWMKHKLESRLLLERSITSNTQMTPPLWQKAKN